MGVVLAGIGVTASVRVTAADGVVIRFDSIGPASATIQIRTHTLAPAGESWTFIAAGPR
ncbi:MAG: hypothetical protein ACYTG6_12955 [Planctomycetota bacterium]